VLRNRWTARAKISGDLADGAPTSAQQEAQNFPPGTIGNHPKHRITPLALYSNHLVTKA
jgi:hypothetical protein